MLYFAAALIATLGFAHYILGERYILIRLFRRDLPKLFGTLRNLLTPTIQNRTANGMKVFLGNTALDPMFQSASMPFNVNPHLINIAIHVFAGAIGIVIGLYLLIAAKATPRHRIVGRVFVGFASVVCITAIVGSALFRFIPLFAVLSLLVPYVLLSGWHVIYTQKSGPNWLDAILLLAGIAGAVALVPILATADKLPGSAAPVVYSTLAALALVMVYDLARWCFPGHWHAGTWRFEHIYKILSALFGMMSAAVGNIFHTTWAQLVPSAVGIVIVIWFMAREWRAEAVRLQR